MIISGIYQILNLINGKVYIGSAKKFKDRKYKHFNDLKRKVHHSQKLQRAYDKYGKENFEFEILEYCNIEDLLKKETWYIKVCDAVNSGYNICHEGRSLRGVKYSQERCDAMSVQRQGNNNPACVLTQNQVLEIRSKYIPHKYTMPMLAKEYNVSRSAICHIVNMTSWNRLNDNYQKPQYFLNENDVEEIFDMLENGISRLEIRKFKNISSGVMSNIINGKTWSNLSFDWTKYQLPSNKKLNESDIKEILDMYKNGLSQYKIADIKNIGQQYVSDIVNGKRWKHITL